MGLNKRPDLDGDGLDGWRVGLDGWRLGLGDCQVLTQTTCGLSYRWAITTYIQTKPNRFLISCGYGYHHPLLAVVLLYPTPPRSTVAWPITLLTLESRSRGRSRPSKKTLGKNGSLTWWWKVDNFCLKTTKHSFNVLSHFTSELGFGVLSSFTGKVSFR
jgi:hypothetical protein